MDDRYRSDGYNLMDVEDAASVIYDYLAEDLALSSTSGSGGTCYSASGNPLFSVQYNSISYRDGRGAHCAGIELDMTITMYSKMSLAFTGTPELCSWRSVISSTNFRVDENERAGDYSLLS